MTDKTHSLEKFKSDLSALGVMPGDTVLLHSSYKSLGGIEGGAAGFFDAFIELLGQDGTLILPTLSYSSVTKEAPVFERESTPSCIGYLPEYFRTSVHGVVRSLHATHSCAAHGKLAKEITSDHELDLTPVGPNSPFAKLPRYNGKILMLGCNKNANTSMHGVEETAEPPYLLLRDEPVEYILRDGEREIRQSGAIRHNFVQNGVHLLQRYSRIIDLLEGDEVSIGAVLDAECVLMSARAVWEKGRAKLLEEPYYFVDTP